MLLYDVFYIINFINLLRNEFGNQKRIIYGKINKLRTELLIPTPWNSCQMSPINLGNYLILVLSLKHKINVWLFCPEKYIKDKNISYAVKIKLKSSRYSVGE